MLEFVFYYVGEWFVVLVEYCGYVIVFVCICVDVLLFVGFDVDCDDVDVCGVFGNFG